MRLKLMLIGLAVSILILLPGCMDDRIRRQISLLNVKTQTARDEFNAVPTAEEKNNVASTYFNDAPAMTQVLEDYAFKRQPTVISLPVAVKGVGHKMSRFFRGAQ